MGSLIEGAMMARPRLEDSPRSRMYIPVPRARYEVTFGSDGWLIRYDGEEYGPYLSERQALLFAIEAAHKLGLRGENAEVLATDATGQSRTAWALGDRFPPDL
jgi:hypothetical protein